MEWGIRAGTNFLGEVLEVFIRVPTYVLYEYKLVLPGRAGDMKRGKEKRVKKKMVMGRGRDQWRGRAGGSGTV